MDGNIDITLVRQGCLGKVGLADCLRQCAIIVVLPPSWYLAVLEALGSSTAKAASSARRSSPALPALPRAVWTM